MFLINSDTKNGTKSDENGKYRRNQQTIAKLTFFSWGYKSQSIAINNQNVINVELEADSENLSEVAVTALGLKRESKELGYTVQTLQAKDLNEVKTVNFFR
jgi:hypothetical protein